MKSRYSHLKPRVVATDLKFPEGPVACADGSVLVTEIGGGCVTRIFADGRRELFADTDGGPNGAAFGPDGCLYVCNNGGATEWAPRSWPYADPGAIQLVFPMGHRQDGPGPSIQRVSADGSRVDLLYRACGDIKLLRPNDLVFDSSGGFWFTDTGDIKGRVRDITSAFYAMPDGKRIVEKIFPLDMPNGIALSPDEKTLYVVETKSRRLWACDLDGPGSIRSRRSLATIPATGPLGIGGCDSMCVDSDGNVLVATLGVGTIAVVAPSGEISAQVHVGDPMTTNVCFGGRNLRTLYVTCGTRGELVAFDNWPVAGMPVRFSR